MRSNRAELPCAILSAAMAIRVISSSSCRFMDVVAKSVIAVVQRSGYSGWDSARLFFVCAASVEIQFFHALCQHQLNVELNVELNV